jgi:hypothetical protein
LISESAGPDWIIFKDEAEGGLTKPVRVNLSFMKFEKVFGDGENGEMTNYDVISEWLELHCFSLEYMVEPYSGCVLAFDTEDHWFMFKVRWV